MYLFWCDLKMLRTLSEKETFSKIENATPSVQSMGSSKQISPAFLKLAFTIHCANKQINANSFTNSFDWHKRFQSSSQSSSDVLTKKSLSHSLTIVRRPDFLICLKIASPTIFTSLGQFKVLCVILQAIFNLTQNSIVCQL